ncbi:MAG: phage late control D family protein [Spirulina sp.]
MVQSGGNAGGGRRPRLPAYDVSYEGADISLYIEKIEVTEELEGSSDSANLVANNYQLHWYNEWRPRLGDRFTVSLGYRDEAFTAPVTYEVDEPTFRIAPDVMELKGLATPVTESLRQKSSNAFEQWTLREMAEYVAEKHGLELVGEVPEILFDRVTQKNEEDLAWLRKLALKYGVIFKVESCERLVFAVESEIEAMPPIYEISRKLLSDDGSTSFKMQTTDTYREAQADYKDPKTNEWMTLVATSDNPEVATGDVLRITGERFENVEQLELRTAEALRKANSTLVEGTLNLEGEVYWRAGLNLWLPDDRDEFGFLGGKYQVRSVKHTLVPEGGRKQGWRSELSVRKVFE